MVGAIDPLYFSDISARELRATVIVVVIPPSLLLSVFRIISIGSKKQMLWTHTAWTVALVKNV